jgi:hypothetical protein
MIGLMIGVVPDARGSVMIGTLTTDRAALLRVLSVKHRSS